MMKFVSRGLVVASLVALSACGGGAEENVAANDVAADDLYNVGAGDLSLDNSLDNGVGSDFGNDVGATGVTDNATGNAADADASVDLNASGNSQ